MNLLGIICAYDIPVKEDVAEATGSGARMLLQDVWEIRALGFNENKMVKTSGGDALVCRTEEQSAVSVAFAACV